MKITFNQKQFNDLFPFHILIDQFGKISGWGKTLPKLVQIPHGTFFLEQFRIVRPKGDSWQFEQLSKLTDKLLIIETKSDKPIQLRGQFELLEDTKEIVFVGAPWFTSTEEIDQQSVP